jgi:hypothetical protein
VCEVHHEHLCFSFTLDDPPHLPTSTIKSGQYYHRLLHCKNWAILSLWRHEFCEALCHSPKTFWHTLFYRNIVLVLGLRPPIHIISYDLPLLCSYIVPYVYHLFPHYLFFFSDIRQVVRVMSTSRVVDKEGFQANFLEHCIDSLNFHIADLLNHVIYSGFLQAWSQDNISLIFKSRANLDPNNYRNLMLRYTFSKFYAIVLHLWLSNELKRRHLKAKGQLVSAWEYQTMDHIFTLTTIIEEACHCSLKVICCFVNF